jgi:hypothetical protein
MVETTQLVSGWVDHLDEAAVMGVEAALRESGGVPPPTVHILLDGLDPPYVGCLVCRPFYRGLDAATALCVLGLLPAALGASRLVVSWEHADLCTALEQPDAEDEPTGLMVLDATRHGHTLRWHPVLMRLGPTRRDGAQPVIAHWGPARRYPDAPLLDPVEELLAVWRQPRVWSETDLLRIVTSLEATGYEMRWVKRRPRRDDPSWVQMLATLME